ISPSFPLDWEGWYSSRGFRDGALKCATGTNWQHNYELNTTRFGDDYVEVLLPRGRVQLFAREPKNAGKMASQQNNAIWNLLVRQEIPFQLVESGADFILGDPRNNLMYTFNDSGELTKIENGKGYVQTLTHTNGKLTEVTDSFGQSLTFEYDQDHLMRVSDGTRDITLAHTGDLLTSVTDADGNVTTYAYDANHPMPGLMTSKTLPEGNSPFTITYDENGRVVSRADANGNATTFEYLSNENGSGSSLLKVAATTEAVITDPLGNIRRCFYNENGQVVTLIDPAGKSIAIGYDNLGRRNSITDRTGATTSWDFHDPSGRVSAIHNPDGGTINFAYASRSLAGLTFYDLSSMTFPDGSSETLVHDGSGNLTSATEQAGNTNILTYNNFG
ncbi:RHS repeat protein, partial [candidate division KSB1 bacterium]|nr:RHS repeat protein [candidate division KSB1 bacterium]